MYIPLVLCANATSCEEKVLQGISFISDDHTKLLCVYCLSFSDQNLECEYHKIPNNLYKINFICTIWIEYENYRTFQETGVYE